MPDDDTKTETEESTKTPAELEIEYQGTKTKVTPEKVIELAEGYQGTLKVLQNLQAQGIIDAQGNPIKKEVEAETETEVEAETETETDDISKALKRVEELEKKFATKQEQDKADAILNQINNRIAVERGKHDFTKEDENAASVVETQVLTKLYQQPNLDIAAEYKKAVEMQEKFIEQKHQKLLKDKINKPKTDGPGGSSNLSGESNKYTAKDLRSGVVLKAAKQRIESLRGNLGG